MPPGAGLAIRLQTGLGRRRALHCPGRLSLGGQVQAERPDVCAERASVRLSGLSRRRRGPVIVLLSSAGWAAAAGSVARRSCG
jgi:hypothetical protein